MPILIDCPIPDAFSIRPLSQSEDDIGLTGPPAGRKKLQDIN